MVWAKRMKRTVGDGGWAFAVWWSLKGKAGRKQRRGWNDETGESVKTGWWRGGKVKWKAWLQKAARQNSWIIDAYNSRQELKIEDKCTDINDVTLCVRHLDLALSCMLTVASSPLTAKIDPFAAQVHVSMMPFHFLSRPCQTVSCTHRPAGHVHVHVHVRVPVFLYSCPDPELTARSSRLQGLLELRTPTWGVTLTLLHLHFSH